MFLTTKVSSTNGEWVTRGRQWWTPGLVRMFYFACKKGVLCIIWNRLGATWDQNDVLLEVWLWAWGDLWSESASRFYFLSFTEILGLLHSFIVHGSCFRFSFLFGPDIYWSLIRWPDDEDRVDRGWITAAPVSHRFSPNLPRDRWSSDNAWISRSLAIDDKNTEMNTTWLELMMALCTSQEKSD